MKFLGLRSIFIKKFNHTGNSKTDNTKFDPLYSGKYLITSICHSFSTEDYKMNIQCAKETLRSIQDDE